MTSYVEIRLPRLEDEIVELRGSLLIAFEVLKQGNARGFVPVQPVDLMEPPRT